jgi:hypothetical protein
VKISDFVERIPESQGESRTLIGAVAKAIDDFRKQAAAVRANRELTPIGHRKEIAKIANGPKQYLTRVTEMVAKDRSELRRRRENLTLPRPDDSVTSELKRAEIRGWLRTLSPAEALRAILEDSSIQEAALNAPRQLSGLNQDMYDRVHHEALLAAHGAEIEALRDEETAAGEITSALEIAGKVVDAEVEDTRTFKRDANGEIVFSNGRPVMTTPEE